MNASLKNNSCSICVFGHRNIAFSEQDEEFLSSLFEDYIVNKGVGIFYFGGFGDFDSVSHKIVTTLKGKYSFLKRVYVCEDYKFIERPNKRPKRLVSANYEAFEYFDMRYNGFYQRIFFRNCEIVDHSDYCVFYVDENAEKSGSLKALQYAKRKKKKIENVFNALK